ncbi:MAG: TetR/AcrR family transcriptional regulator [Desulfurivibrionaceae bacterium]|jgi:AcrR family transcriptional regulator
MPPNKENTARDRIIETALNLFYKQGYLATGINQIIAESQVAKATFYAQFPSKEALCIAYLQARHEIWMGWLTASIQCNATPKEKLLGIFSFLKQWMQESNYRGCAFLNIASEVPLSDSAIRNEVVKHKDGLQKYIRETIVDIFESNQGSVNLDPEKMAKTVYVLVEGSIVSSQNYSAIWPIEVAQEAVENLMAE